ncbi:MAG: division/cell wall cluster transcriptional repressor MraZ [Clostridiales bacterium]|jgi:MraZ protein|nr:division/cell wall cluster transcriptional repressor MraZ [Clostridiales bacterium]
MLIGTHFHTVDDKGRFRLPPKFKSELGESFVLVKGVDGCVYAFSEEGFKTHFADKLGSQSVVDKDLLKSLRHLLPSAYEAETDNQGRVPLPSHLKEHAGITKEIAILGMVGHVEIWDKERWARYQDGSEFDAAVSALKEYKI